LRYILSLDQGTTSSRASCSITKAASAPWPSASSNRSSLSPAWVEHDPEEIAASQIAVALEALSQAQVQPKDIAAIASPTSAKPPLSGTAPPGSPSTTPLSGRIAVPLHSAQNSSHKRRRVLIQQRTGLLIDAYFSASKISWILDHVPNARQLAEANRLAFRAP